MVVINDVKDFNIEQVLECGQCFHFTKLNFQDYGVVAKDKYLHVSQSGNQLFFHNINQEEYETIWKHYFDLDRDYSEIKKQILAIDNNLSSAILAKDGIRIINQDFFETLISFIISQNKQIPQIKQIVFNLSKRYGQMLETDTNTVAYAFPKVEDLVNVSDEELRQCKMGFRAPYILDACRLVANGDIDETRLSRMSVEDARAKLMTIKGVGEKVANCTLLFGLGRREVFPVDVWMKRIMETLYIHKDSKKEDIEKYANDKYGDLGGYAQQYLFYYGRENNIGK